MNQIPIARELALELAYELAGMPDDLREYGYNHEPMRATEYGRPIASFADEPAKQAEVAACMEFLRTHCVASKRGLSSYVLKHDVERWSQRNGGPNYIANGSAIAAALILGIGTKAGYPNATIRVKVRVMGAT